MLKGWSHPNCMRTKLWQLIFRRLLLLAVIALACGALWSSAATLYVDTNSATPLPPYDSWAHAALTIQDAIDFASAGDVALVTNGTYAVGSRFVAGVSNANRVVINKALTVQSVNGPAFTTIQGARPDGTNSPAAIRAVYLVNGAILSGFKISGGGTGTTPNTNQMGGGVLGQSINAMVTNCFFTNNMARQGGGAAFCTVIDSQILLNTATDGGGIYHARATNCLIGLNYAVSGGGANDCFLSGCVVSNNVGPTGSYRSGGGIFSCTAINCSILNNTIPYGWGGGAYASTLTNCILAGNRLEYWYSAGASYNCTLDHCEVHDNFGAAPVTGGTAVSCSIHDNTSLATAGASGATLVNCVVSNNFSLGRDAGPGGCSSCRLLNCLVTRNRAYTSGALSGGSATNCTITENVSNDGAVNGGTYVNCIIYGNTDYALVTANGSGTFINCCTLPASGANCITNDPAFVDPAAGNWTLRSTSPCIDAGMNFPGMPTTDLAGYIRMTNGVIDIGAYEFQASSIPSSWLKQFQLPDDGSADFTDSDGDGANNYQEWRAGTSPVDSNSVFRVLTPSSSASGIIITWRSVRNKTYAIQRSSSPTSGFVTVVTNIAGQVVTTSALDPSADKAQPNFYRVIVY
jgi:hypothetical protein